MMEKPCTIITFVSGKGGVGKTLLSVNLAKFLAGTRIKVLLLDFDLLNRGATALLRTDIGKRNTTFHDLTKRIKSIPTKSRLLELERSFHFLPATRAGKTVDWEHMPSRISVWAKKLRMIIKRLARQYEPDVIIIDSAAGPHPLTIATAGLADFTIIVSEADSVTWDGTLNYRTYLTKVHGETKEFFFVLNKIPQKFRFDELDRFYRKELGEFFKNLKILSYIPFEQEIFESFGRIKFLVQSLPKSVFSSKIKLLALNLLSDRLPDRLGPHAFAFIEADSVRKRLTSRLPLMDTLIRALGLILIALGLVTSFIGTGLLDIFIRNPIGALGLLYTIGGIIITLFMLFRRR